MALSRTEVEALVQSHLHLAPITARTFARRCPASVEADDLISECYIALYNSAKRFNPGRAVRFETYAIHKMRGAMLEMLRTDDWAPRSVRDGKKAIDSAVSEFESRMQRQPSDEELAAALGWDCRKLKLIREQIHQATLLSLDTKRGEGDSDFLEYMHEDAPGPEERAVQSQQYEAVAAAVDRLPERERIAIQSYFRDDSLTHRQIGQMLGISESRAYQLHQQALVRMRMYLVRDQELFQ